jgi:hypothetical protein
MSRSTSLLLLFALSAPSWFNPTLSAQTVYAAVWGHPKYVVGSSTLYSGLYRTTDFGETWTHLGPQNLKTFSMDAVDATKGRTLYIAAGNGVHRSLDSGRSWKIVTDWRVTEVLDVAVDQRDPRKVYAGTAHGLWVSGDGGESWGPTPLSAYIARVEIADSTVRLYVEDSLSSLYESDTSGARTLAIWTIPNNIPKPWEHSRQLWPTVATGRIVLGEPMRIDSFVVKGSSLRTIGGFLAATWGNGIYRANVGMTPMPWRQSGLEGSQVWRLVMKRY